MGGSYYTLSEIQDISMESNLSLTLNSKTSQAFEHILMNIVIPPPEEQQQQPTILSSSRPFDKDRNRRRGQKSKDRPMDWENVRVPAFTPTKIQTKEGIEKQINDFRILLNKISSKNYETQRDLIFSKMDEILLINEDNSNADLEKVAATIFDIASANKFYSDLYADLYVELINKFEIFDDLLDGLLDKYYESLKNIHYVDHNVDYDGFCNYTKTNDLRKAMASFIINLMIKGAVEKAKVLGLILSIQTLLESYIYTDNRVNEVDEIIENLFLLLTQSHSILKTEEKWLSNVLPYIQELSKLKSKDCKSLSSRAVFKCMDILDNLKKK
jgi:hypothetical protein